MFYKYNPLAASIEMIFENIVRGRPSFKVDHSLPLYRVVAQEHCNLVLLSR